MNTKELREIMEAYAQVYAPQQLDELSKSTLGSYVKKASKDAADRSFDHGESERRQYDDHPDDEREGKRIETRKRGISRAVDKMMRKENIDIFDTVLEFLQVEGYAKTLEEAEWLMANKIDEEAIQIIVELTGGKGHPGYKAGSRDLGPMQAGHPADSRKRQVKGGTMSQRHGYHLGDIDDDDDDEDDYESIVKSQSRDKRELVRKPLRDKVKAARKVLSKESFDKWYRANVL